MSLLLAIGTAAIIFIGVCMGLASRFWIFDLFSNYLVQYVLVIGAWSALYFLRRRFYMGLGLLVFAVIMAAPLSTMFFHASVASRAAIIAPHESELFTIFHANVNKTNTSYESLLKIIRKTSPQVISLAEVTNGWREAIEPAIEGQYPFRVTVPLNDYRGMEFFSQIPITDHDIISLSDRSAPIIRILLKNGVTVFALHPLSPISESWARERNESIAYLAQEVSATEGPVIVAGDLNTTEHSPAYKPLVSYAELSNANSGHGWEPTWMRMTPLAVSIDHILYKGSTLSVVNFDVLSSIGSDHRPLMATFLLSPS